MGALDAMSTTPPVRRSAEVIPPRWPIVVIDAGKRKERSPVQRARGGRPHCEGEAARTELPRSLAGDRGPRNRDTCFLPQLDCTVPAAAGQELSLRIECHCGDHVLVAGQ